MVINMSTKTKIVIVVVMVVTAYAFGRWSAPVKVVTEIKTVEVEKKTKDTKETEDQHKRTETTITVDHKPDGETHSVTTIVQTDDKQSGTESKSTDDKSKTTDDKKEETKSSSRLNLSLLGGIDLNTSKNIIGGSISRDLIGPVSVGIWGMNNQTCGFSIGLTF
jgi:hypothetical protein